MKQAYNIPRLRPDAAGGEESGQVKNSLPAYPDNYFDDPRFREEDGLWPDEDEEGYPEEEEGDE